MCVLRAHACMQVGALASGLQGLEATLHLLAAELSSRGTAPAAAIAPTQPSAAAAAVAAELQQADEAAPDPQLQATGGGSGGTDAADGSVDGSESGGEFSFGAWPSGEVGKATPALQRAPAAGRFTAPGESPSPVPGP